MIIAFEGVLPACIIIALGVIVARYGLLSRPMWEGVERLVYYVCFPALIIFTLTTTNLDATEAGRLAGALTLAVITMALVALALKPLMARYLATDDPAFTSVFQGAVRWNTYMGLAISGALFGDQGFSLAAIGVAVLVTLNNLLSVTALSVYGAKPENMPTGGWAILRVFRDLLKNPLILACLAAGLIRLSGVPLYEPALNGIEILGRASLALGLLSVGASLNLPDDLSFDARVALACGLRLLLMPLLGLSALTLFGVTGLAFSVGMIACAVPCAISSYILARQLGGDGPLMARIVTTQTVLSALTLPVVIALTAP